MGTSPRGRKTRSSHGGGDEEEDEVDQALEITGEWNQEELYWFKLSAVSIPWSSFINPCLLYASPSPRDS